MRFLPFILPLALLAPIVARADEAPQASSQQAADEAIILEQLTARRDWQARAIALQQENEALKKQLAEAKKPMPPHTPDPPK